MKPIDWYAERYTEKFGLALVPIEPRRKFPSTQDWGNRVITEPAKAGDYYRAHPDWNMGLALGPSQMCSLDIDCSESWGVILDEFGIPRNALDHYPTIQGAAKGCRVMFRVPDGMALPYAKLNWPQREGATQYTVVELRAAGDGKQRQDVLPPSIHPDTGEPYRWLVQPPESRMAWPEPPGWLLAIWEAWEQFKPQLKDACPWVERDQTPPPAPTKPTRDRHGVSVIDECLSREPLRDTLTRLGHKPIGRRRFLSPHSGTGLPGVVMFDGEQSCWIHHASDPLCSEDSGKPVNAFDLICHYEHGGDPSKAVKALSSQYGMKPQRVQENPPAVTPEPPTVQITPQGEHKVHYDAPAEGCGDYMSPLIYTSGKEAKPKKHIANLREICRRLGVVVRYNEISKEEEILIPKTGFSRDNEANASLAWLKSECSLFDFSPEAVQEFITVLADENQFNPVRAWVDSKPWDGRDRIQALCDTVHIPGGENNQMGQWLKERLIYRWAVSAIAGAYNRDGVSAHGVLVFQGAQYLGKTAWFKSLVPRDLSLLKDGLLLRPDDKDSVKQACSYWMVELGELDSTFRRSDIAALKAFITNDTDVFRKPYAKRESRFARRTVFFGSVNPKEFLHDATGNRRYWTIECEKLDHDHDIDMQQFWAQMRDCHAKGESHFLTPEEMDALNQHNEDFMAAEPTEEKILNAYDWGTEPKTWRWASATEILQEVGNDRPTRAECTAAALAIRKVNGDLAKRQKGRRVLAVPPKKIGYQ